MPPLPFPSLFSPLALPFPCLASPLPCVSSPVRVQLRQLKCELGVLRSADGWVRTHALSVLPPTSPLLCLMLVCPPHACLPAQACRPPTLVACPLPSTPFPSCSLLPHLSSPLPVLPTLPVVLPSIPPPPPPPPTGAHQLCVI
ncbi:unnamed protein product [Closterium sp. NIES-54]